MYFCDIEATCYLVEGIMHVLRVCASSYVWEVSSFGATTSEGVRRKARVKELSSGAQTHRQQLQGQYETGVVNVCTIFWIFYVFIFIC